MKNAMEWSEMKERHRSGMSISQISRDMGCDRKTVRKYVRADAPPGYARKGGGSVLDPYKDHLRTRLASHPLSAAKLCREIKGQGYAGSLTTVKRFIAPIKDASKIVAEIRFETEPGEQAQVDWIDLGRMPVGNSVEHVYVFVMVLSWSRMRYLRMTTDCRTDTFIDCHLRAFEHFGGWTKTILYDNTKNVVLKRALRSSESEFNEMYLDFARHHGITPRLCRPGIQGAKTKGKVERTNQYVEKDFLLGSVFDGIGHANSLGLEWCGRVNSEVHGTTREVPKDRWPKEGLTPFGSIVPYQVTIIDHRKASRDCFVQWKGNSYSLPWKCAGRECRVLERGGRLTIEVAGENVAEHDVLEGSRKVSKRKEHFEGLYKLKRDENLAGHRARLAGPGEAPMLSFRPPVEVERRDLSSYDMFTGGPQ